MYFVVDGHHRVALAHELGMEYIDAEVTALTTSHALTPDVDVRQLIHTEQHRIFKERSGLLVRHPEAKILFSRPTGYGQILDLVEAHAYQMSVRAGELVPLEEATADWYETEYLPAIAAVHEAELPQAYEHTTKGDIYLWVQAKRRELRTTNRTATWADAALAARREGVSRASSGPSSVSGGGPFRGGATIGSARPPGPQLKPSTRHGRDLLEPAGDSSELSRRTTDGVKPT